MLRSCSSTAPALRGGASSGALALIAALGVAVAGCSQGDDDAQTSDGGNAGTAADATHAATGGMPAATTGSGGSKGLGGTGGAANTLGTGGRSTGAATGGSGAGSGGASGGSGGAGPNTVDAGMVEHPAYELDCGPSGVAIESHGPPSNRVNYVILGDAYTEAELDTKYMDHIQIMLDGRFRPEQEPYLRYRKFVNICALKVASQQSGVGTQAGNTAFDGYGNDESRLGYINDQKVNAAIKDLLPSEIEVDWTSVVLNGSSWWNSGGRLMVWSGGHPSAALAAQHEGGHAFQRLADEYGGNCTFSGDEKEMRINVTKDGTGTAGKWTQWLDFDQTPGTGKQGIFEGAQYCDKGAFRPSQESVMNQLQRSPSFNSISLEQAVRIIYEAVRPIDVPDSTPASTKNAAVLEVRLVDPAVLKVDWSVDGAVVAEDAGERFDLAAHGVVSGQHAISARAYDDTEWVLGDRKELEQTLEWTIDVP